MQVAVMVMGVSGAGKTALGKALAVRIGATFIDGDDLHPAENVEKMRRGAPLNDANRAPWLHSICERLGRAVRDEERVVLACSALRSTYRRQFRAAAPALLFIYLRVDRHTVARRLAGRAGHFMPASLLESQFDTLEEPDSGEAFVINAAQPLNAALAQVLALLPPPIG